MSLIYRTDGASFCVLLCIHHFPLWDTAMISLNTSLLFPFPGDSAVSVGERVPGACLLPPPNGPGGAFPLARPDDALSLGQHYRPREADPVSPGICHWPQVSLCIYSLVDTMSDLYFINPYIKSTHKMEENDCIRHLPKWCFIGVLLTHHYSCLRA